MQTYRLWRGSRVLHLRNRARSGRRAAGRSVEFVLLLPLCLVGRAARNVSHGERDAAAGRARSDSSRRTTSSCPTRRSSTTILTGGLTFHRRHEERMLDTLLITRGERQRKFRLGIGIDLAHPLHEAIGLLTPPVVIARCAAAVVRRQRLALAPQLAECDRHEPVAAGGRAAASSAFALRLLETAGRPANLAITAFRPIRIGRDGRFSRQSARPN